MGLANFGITKCVRRAPFGWRCVCEYNHLGECVRLPRWWNVRASIRWSKQIYPL